MTIRILIIFLISLVAAAPGAAAAENRLALVIGNAAYAAAPLANPGNDARLIASSLRESGFEVMSLVDADRRAITDAVRDFANRLKSAGPNAVAAFYFAGHGVQIDGRNFLIPVRARIDGAADLEFEAVEAQWILNRIGETGVDLSLFILDACRNNPFKSVNRAATRGLARMDAPRGSLLSYSTAPGDAALDGDGANSPYSAALAAAIRTPGLKVEDVFKAARREVVERTGGRQTPWESSSLLGDFYFTPGDAPAPTPVLAAPSPHDPGDVFRDCPDCPEMIAIGGGDARIGSRWGAHGAESHETPDALVSVRRFALARTEVTRGDYARFLSDTGRNPPPGCWYLFGVWVYDAGLSWRKTGYDQADDHPAVCIRWSDAAAYAEWMSRKTGRRYRLPSEAEWEFAAQRRLWDNSAEACAFGNVHDRTANDVYGSGLVHTVAPCEDGVAATASVGRFKPNRLGLSDMTGNVSEWTADCWNAGHAARPADGSARNDGNCARRVVKGASFISPEYSTRPAWRLAGVAGDPTIYLGFRLARDLP